MRSWLSCVSGGTVGIFLLVHSAECQRFWVWITFMNEVFSLTASAIGVKLTQALSNLSEQQFSQTFRTSHSLGSPSCKLYHQQRQHRRATFVVAELGLAICQMQFSILPLANDFIAWQAYRIRVVKFISYIHRCSLFHFTWLAGFESCLVRRWNRCMHMGTGPLPSGRGEPCQLRRALNSIGA